MCGGNGISQLYFNFRWTHDFAHCHDKVSSQSLFVIVEEFHQTQDNVERQLASTLFVFFFFFFSLVFLFYLLFPLLSTWLVFGLLSFSIYVSYLLILKGCGVFFESAKIAQSLCNKLDKRFPQQELFYAFIIIYLQYWNQCRVDESFTQHSLVLQKFYCHAKAMNDDTPLVKRGKLYTTLEVLSTSFLDK